MTLPELDSREVVVTEQTEILFRQATTPLWDEKTRLPSSHAFGPSKADQQMASFTRSSKVTAQQSRDWHNANAASTSHGVWGCAVATLDSVALRAVDDEAMPGNRAPGHSYVDYRGQDKKAERLARSVLLADALERGEFATSA